VSFQAPITMDATSTVNLEGDLIVAAGQSFTVHSTGPKLGTLDNKEGVDVSGTMTVDANLVQPGNNGDTSINITNGGHLTLVGSTTGGGIGVTSGTLEFAPLRTNPSAWRGEPGTDDCRQGPQFMHQSEETASNNFNAFLSFGLKGALQFDGVKGPLTVTLTGNELIVSALGSRSRTFAWHSPRSPTQHPSFRSRATKCCSILYRNQSQ
jgi:hypothetical protein